MNIDGFAHNVIRRLTDPAGNSLEPMPVDEVRKLTSGDVEALKAAEPDAWWAAVAACADEYRKQTERRREQNREYQARLDAGHEFAGVAESLRYHVRRNDADIELWEAIDGGDADRLKAALETDSEAWQRLRWQHHIFDQSAHPAVRYYENRIATPLMVWNMMTGGGKHAPV